jgi:hypothetical protein
MNWRVARSSGNLYNIVTTGGSIINSDLSLGQVIGYCEKVGGWWALQIAHFLCHVDSMEDRNNVK